MSSTTTVKIVCNGCIRRFVLPEHSFEAFRQLVCQHAELSPLSSITFTFSHPSCGSITVTDTPSLQRCLQVASAHNIIARLNVSTGASDCDMKTASSPAEASCPASPTPTPAIAASVPRPQVVVAKPVVSVASGEQAVLPFDLNSLINGVAAQTGALASQTGALVSSFQPEELSNFVNGLLSQAESAANNIFTSSQAQSQQHSPQAQSQSQSQEAQSQQPKQPQLPQQTPVLPDLGNLLSSIMAQPGIANILSAVQPQQPQQPQAQSQAQQQQQQPQQQAIPGVAQLLGSILPQGSSPFGLQQMLSLLQPSQPGNQQQANNQGSQLANVVQLAQVLGPVLPQVLSMVGTMIQQQQPRPVAPVNPPAAASSPLGGLGAMAQSLAQQAFGTAPSQPNVSSGSSDGSEYSQQLSVLAGMGFNDRYLNTQLLREANGNVRVVFDQLRRREQFAASLGN